MIDRPSGAHSTLASPSAPATIRAFHVSSVILKTLTAPCFEPAPNTYSESQDHPICVIGEDSTSQVRSMRKESARRTMSLSPTAVRIHWAPLLNSTRKLDCLYAWVKSIVGASVASPGVCTEVYETRCVWWQRNKGWRSDRLAAIKSDDLRVRRPSFICTVYTDRFLMPQK
jgi:hypothetical protein